MVDIIVGRNKGAIEKYGTKGCILLGKEITYQHNTVSFLNNMYMDVTDAHVTFICGKRGGGKSYTMGVFAEGFKLLDEDVQKRLSIILLDTMGIYWSMKHANKKEAKLLEPYGIEPEGMDVKIFTPFKFYEEYKKKGIPTDVPFSIDASEVTGAEWCKGFKQEKYSSEGILINETIVQLKEEMKQTKKKFSLDDIIKHINNNDEYDEDTKMKVSAMFETAKGWGLFSDVSTPLADLAKGGQITVLDVSCYATMEGGWDVKALVVGIVAQHLFEQRMIARKDEEFKNIVHLENYFESQNEALNMTDMPLVWLVIDEAHEFLPKDKEDWNAATMPLMIVMREGRQPGISLVVATQQPGKIHTDVMTQSDIVLGHRVTAAIDVEALGLLAQSGNKFGLIRAMESLPPLKGCAVMFDVANDKIHQMRVRPRMTWHGGASPNALDQ